LKLEKLSITDLGFISLSLSLSLSVPKPMGQEDMFDWVAFTGSASELLERRKRRDKSPTELAYVLYFMPLSPSYKETKT